MSFVWVVVAVEVLVKAGLAVFVSGVLVVAVEEFRRQCFKRPRSEAPWR
jgi:hypothetical protein